jgi:hypothetical protein
MRKEICIAIISLLAACGVPPVGHVREPLLVAAGGINHFPFAYDLPGGKSLIAYSTHRDEVVSSPVDSARVIGAAGAVSAANFYLSGVAGALPGLYAASYITTAIDARSERVHG